MISAGLQVLGNAPLAREKSDKPIEDLVPTPAGAALLAYANGTSRLLSVDCPTRLWAVIWSSVGHVQVFFWQEGARRRAEGGPQRAALQ